MSVTERKQVLTNQSSLYNFKDGFKPLMEENVTKNRHGTFDSGDKRLDSHP